MLSNGREHSIVLVAGANAAAADEILRALEGSELDVRIAPSGEAALAQQRELHPDIIVLDVATPPAGGYALLEQIRSDERGALTPIVMTAADLGAERKRAYEAGAIDLLERPIDPAALLYRLRFALRAGRAIRATRETKARLTRVQRIARLGSWELSLEGGRFSSDDELRRLLGLEGDADPTSLDALLERICDADRARVAKTMGARRPHRVEFRTTSGRSVQQEAWLAQDEANGEVRLIGSVLDITQLKDAQRRITRLAYYDSVTGLPNRTFLKEHLLRVLGKSRREGHFVAVLGMDLDFFKRINDTLGHHAGDLLLEEVGKRITRSIRSGDSVVCAREQEGPGAPDLPSQGNAAARMGGDEFIVVLEGLRAPEDAAVVARRILDQVGMPVNVGTTEVVVGCSIGIAVCPDNGDTPEVLLKHADTALYHAKETGRNQFQFFSDSLNERARRRMTIENGLRAALQKGEFLLHYQPKVRMGTQDVLGVEALVRWPRPEGGFISPEEFIPVAEDTGMIIPLGAWVLETAVEQARSLNESGGPFVMAVNVSRRQLTDPSFAAKVAAVLERTGLPPHLLELEITEGAIMKDTAAAIALLQKLKELGVRIALDDFGTGYSSLAYLSRFPLDTLKIDRSFVRHLGKAPSTVKAITTAIIALSKSLSLNVVAEGVETEEQIDFLVGQGCVEAQGFLFARPMDATSLAAWLEAHSAPQLRAVGQ